MVEAVYRGVVWILLIGDVGFGDDGAKGPDRALLYCGCLVERDERKWKTLGAEMLF